MSDREPTSQPASGTIDVRTFAALDLDLHGRTFIIGEFTLCIALCGGLGALFADRGLFASGTSINPVLAVIGLGFVGISVNYVPLALYAVSLARGGIAHAVAAPARHPERARQYTIQGSLLLLVPFAMAALAVWQEASKRALAAR